MGCPLHDDIGASLSVVCSGITMRMSCFCTYGGAEAASGDSLILFGRATAASAVVEGRRPVAAVTRSPFVYSC